MHRYCRSATARAALLWALAGTGCTASITGTDPGRAEIAAAGSTAGTEAPSHGPATLCGTDREPPVVPAAPLRRLSHAQYDLSVGYALENEVDASRDFPGEASEHGFVGGLAQTPVSEPQLRAYQTAAARLASEAVVRFREFAPCAEETEACALTTLARVGERLLRRPLDAYELAENSRAFASGQMAMAAAGDAARGFAEGLRWGLESLLFSPKFLYRAEVTTPELTLASRLSYMLWQAPPDEALLALAETGTLLANLEQEVARLSADPRSSRMLRRFIEQWFGLGRLNTLDRNLELFPTFSPDMAAAMKEETMLSFEELWRSGADFSSIFTANYSFINESLSAIYQLPAPGAEFRRVTLGGPRLGLLTGSGVLAAYANASATSPIHRGLFIYNRLLCREVPPPPAALMVTLPEPQAGQTTREGFENHASAAVCKGCHSSFDGLGFAFEKYDSLGQYRELEDGAAIDTSGSVVLDDEQRAFADALELNALLANSREVEECFLRQWFRSVFGRDWTHADACERQRFEQAFNAAGRRLSSLPSITAHSAWFTQRAVLGDGGAQP